MSLIHIWVGLVVPHLCRKLVGSNFKVLLPCSMLAGAAFLLLVDKDQLPRLRPQVHPPQYLPLSVGEAQVFHLQHHRAPPFRSIR